MKDVDDAREFGSGKGHRDENFPVASFFVRGEHRDIILAFYNFARAADDVADHPSLPGERRLEILENMRKTLLGLGGGDPSAETLRRAILDRGLDFDHPLDLLRAFCLDVTKSRYRDWDDLMDYCMLSAAPVGRFVLDVHGEARSTWTFSDPLCNALQVINHLQDCGKDFRDLDRVYIPLESFNEAGLAPDVLAADRAPEPLRAAIARLAARTIVLLDAARPLAYAVGDRRLALEVAIIQKLAESLTNMLHRRDPLSQKVHHGPVRFAGLCLAAVLQTGIGRLWSRPAAGAVPAGRGQGHGR